MADYLLVHERGPFEDCVRPALALAWLRRSFTPCHDLARQLAPVALDYAERCHGRRDEMLLPRLVTGLPFDRSLWRAVVGEVLVVAAVEMPQLPPHLESLAHLLPVAAEALHGCRDLTFGAVPYRPGQAAYNGPADVARLASLLRAADPAAWSEADLVGLPEVPTDEDRREELAFARQWFAVLAELYENAARGDRVVVCESLF